jgi:hypothetical protein
LPGNTGEGAGVLQSDEREMPMYLVVIGVLTLAAGSVVVSTLRRGR